MNTPTLEQLRKAIDSIDDEILSLIAQRLTLASSVGERKQVLGLPVAQSERESTVKDRIAVKAAALGVDAQLAQVVITAIIKASRNRQTF